MYHSDHVTENTKDLQSDIELSLFTYTYSRKSWEWSTKMDSTNSVIICRLNWPSQYLVQ